jgi:hypothetical protein
MDDIKEPTVGRASLADASLEDKTGLAMVLDPSQVKALVRKLDLHIMPIFMILYLLSFLDR